MVSSIGLIHGSLGLLNLTAAGFSLFILYRKKFLSKTPLGVSLTHLAVNQLGYSMFCHIFLLFPSKSSQSVVWSSHQACDFYGFLKTYFEASILLSTFLLCVERYLNSSRSVRYKPSLFFKFSLGIWLYSAFWALLPFAGWGSYRRKGFACDISIAQSEDEGWTDFSFFISFVFATIVVPSAIILSLICRHHSRKSTTVWKVNRQEGQLLLLDSSSIGRITTYLSIIAFTLTTAKVMLILVDLLPSWTGSGPYFEIFYPIISYGLLFIGPIWYLLGVGGFRKELLVCKSQRKTQSVRFSEVVYTKGKSSESATVKGLDSPPLVPRSSLRSSKSYAQPMP